jgi:ABC-type glycerol-3-phosphate transport system substrate-binding protein
MKRFLMLVAVGVVAAAMYVAASPASQQGSGPTAKQFRALQKKVGKMSRILKTVKVQAEYANDYVKNCLTGTRGGTMPVSEFGDALNHTNGYQYFNGTSATYTTALDIDTSDTPGAYLQKVARGCATR